MGLYLPKRIKYLVNGYAYDDRYTEQAKIHFNFALKQFENAFDDHVVDENEDNCHGWYYKVL